mgnify:CR=1 FL=1
MRVVSGIQPTDQFTANDAGDQHQCHVIKCVVGSEREIHWRLFLVVFCAGLTEAG